MIDILVATHGDFAQGLCSAAQVIMGPVEQLESIGLHLEDSIDEFTDQVLDFCDKAKNDVLILTDLQGASPYNASARAISQIQNKTIICLTGVNLPILLDGLVKRETMDIEALSSDLMDTGKEGINKLALSMYQ